MAVRAAAQGRLRHRQGGHAGQARGPGALRFVRRHPEQRAPQLARDLPLPLPRVQRDLRRGLQGRRRVARALVLLQAEAAAAAQEREQDDAGLEGLRRQDRGRVRVRLHVRPRHVDARDDVRHVRDRRQRRRLRLQPHRQQPHLPGGVDPRLQVHPARHARRAGDGARVGRPAVAQEDRRDRAGPHPPAPRRGLRHGRRGLRPRERPLLQQVRGLQLHHPTHRRHPRVPARRLPAGPRGGRGARPERPLRLPRQEPHRRQRRRRRGLRGAPRRVRDGDHQHAHVQAEARGEHQAQPELRAAGGQRLLRAADALRPFRRVRTRGRRASRARRRDPPRFARPRSASGRSASR